MEPATPAPQPVAAVLAAVVSWARDRPQLAAVLAAALVVTVAASWVTGRSLVAGWRHRQLARGARLVAVAPPPEVNPAGAAALWTNLIGVLTPPTWRRLVYGIPHVAVEYAWAGRQLTISVWTPGTVPPGVAEAAVRAAWPGATTTTAPAGPPIPADIVAATGGSLVPALPDTLPLAVDHDTDPLRPLVAVGALVRPGEHAAVQVLARPAPPGRARRARRAAAALRHGRRDPVLDTVTGLGTAAARAAAEPVTWLAEVFLPGPPRRPTRAPDPATHPGATSATGAAAARRDPAAERDVRAVLDKTTTGPLFEAAIRYAVATTRTGDNGDPARREERLQRRLRGLAHALASAFAAHTARNRLHRVRLRHPVAVLAARRLGRGFLLNTAELAYLAGLPTDVAVPGLDRARAKPMPAPVAVPPGGRGAKILGLAQVGGHSVALPVADARHHIHLVGKTGTGKSTLLLNLILDDVRAGRGAVVIDPRGDLVTDVLDRLPASVAETPGRLAIIDPDQTNPAAFNPLEGEDPHLTADNLVGIFSRIFQRHWGPRIDDTLRVACLTLMQHANPTLSLVPPLLNDAQFRARFTVGLDDPEGLHGYRQWYDSMNPPMRAQVIGPVLARLRQFLLRDFVKRVIGGPASTLDMAAVLDRGLLLCRLPKGVLGEDTVRVLGSLLVARVWQAATARASRPEHARRDAALYVDECHNFLNLPGSVADMLAEARGYRLSLVLAHQDLPQLPRDVAAAASANARNKIYFTVDPKDAKDLAAHTLPELDEHDLAHLDKHTAAARLVVDGRETPAFTLITRQPPPLLGHAATIRAACATATSPRPAPADPGRGSEGGPPPPARRGRRGGPAA
jgi:hypothetical protein